MDIKTFIEKAAELEHQRWARWQSWVHSMGAVTPDNCFLAIPLARINSWNRQICNPYPELSEAEKESDRKEVRKYFPLLRELMLECVGENWSLKGNFNGSDPNDISLLSENKGYNRRGVEVVERINKMFEVK